MEDEYPIKEIKVMEGVYIWKPEKKTDKNTQDNNTNNNSTKKDDDGNNNSQNNNNNIINTGKKTSIGENTYLCHGKDELIKIYEYEFEELGNNVLSLFQSNEDMMEFDPNDYDLIQAREENLELIDKKLNEIIKIQEKMKEVCEMHPLVNVDIFEYFGIGKNPNDNKEKNNEVKINIKKDELIEVNPKEENKIENNIIKNENNIKEEKENEIDSKNKIENNNEITTEIEL